MRSLVKLAMGIFFAAIAMITAVQAHDKGQNLDLAQVLKNKHSDQSNIKSADPVAQDRLNKAETTTLAIRLIGHIGMANITNLHNMNPETTANIRIALDIIKKLENYNEPLNIDFLRFGKFKYKNTKGSYEFFLPLRENTFVVRILPSEFMHSRKPSTEMTDAQMIMAKTVLNIPLIKENLENTYTALKAKNLGEVQSSLTLATSGISLTPQSQPVTLETTRGHLILTNELVKNKNFNGARFALTRAEETLKTIKTTLDKAQISKIDALQKEIVLLRREIKEVENKRSSPSFFKTVERKIKGWIHRLERLTNTKGKI